MTASNLSRRGALSVLAAFTAAPAIALPGPADKANDLWADRQAYVDLLAHLSADYDTAKAKLPAWAQPGPDRIDQSGNACGDIVNWPLDPTVTPPPLGYRFVRPSLDRCREDFDFVSRVIATSPAARAKARAVMRSRMRTIIARLRERKKLYEELNLSELSRQMTASCNSILAAEEAIGELEQSPNVIAAQLLASLGDDCDRTSRASGNGYCGTMAMALVALRGLLPDLSGMIRDHAALFVGNPTLPLAAMPFAPV
jgi:hypothetical protein